MHHHHHGESGSLDPAHFSGRVTPTRTSDTGREYSKDRMGSPESRCRPNGEPEHRRWSSPSKIASGRLGQPAIRPQLLVITPSVAVPSFFTSPHETPKHSDAFHTPPPAGASALRRGEPTSARFPPAHRSGFTHRTATRRAEPLSAEEVRPPTSAVFKSPRVEERERPQTTPIFPPPEGDFPHSSSEPLTKAAATAASRICPNGSTPPSHSSSTDHLIEPSPFTLLHQLSTCTPTHHTPHSFPIDDRGTPPFHGLALDHSDDERSPRSSRSTQCWMGMRLQPFPSPAIASESSDLFSEKSESALLSPGNASSATLLGSDWPLPFNEAGVSRRKEEGDCSAIMSVNEAGVAAREEKHDDLKVLEPLNTSQLWQEESASMEKAKQKKFSQSSNKTLTSPFLGTEGGDSASELPTSYREESELQLSLPEEAKIHVLRHPSCTQGISPIRASGVPGLKEFLPSTSLSSPTIAPPERRGSTDTLPSPRLSPLGGRRSSGAEEVKTEGVAAAAGVVENDVEKPLPPGVSSGGALPILCDRIEEGSIGVPSSDELLSAFSSDSSGVDKFSLEMNALVQHLSSAVGKEHAMDTTTATTTAPAVRSADVGGEGFSPYIDDRNPAYFSLCPQKKSTRESELTPPGFTRCLSHSQTFASREQSECGQSVEQLASTEPNLATFIHPRRGSPFTQPIPPLGEGGALETPGSMQSIPSSFFELHASELPQDSCRQLDFNAEGEVVEGKMPHRGSEQGHHFSRSPSLASSEGGRGRYSGVRCSSVSTPLLAPMNTPRVPSPRSPLSPLVSEAGPTEGRSPRVRPPTLTIKTHGVLAVLESVPSTHFGERSGSQRSLVLPVDSEERPSLNVSSSSFAQPLIAHGLAASSNHSFAYREPLWERDPPSTSEHSSSVCSSSEADPPSSSTNSQERSQGVHLQGSEFSLSPSFSNAYDAPGSFASARLPPIHTGFSAMATHGRSFSQGCFANKELEQSPGGVYHEVQRQGSHFSMKSQEEGEAEEQERTVRGKELSLLWLSEPGCVNQNFHSECLSSPSPSPPESSSKLAPRSPRWSPRIRSVEPEEASEALWGSHSESPCDPH